MLQYIISLFLPPNIKGFKKNKVMGESLYILAFIYCLPRARLIMHIYQKKSTFVFMVLIIEKGVKTSSN